MLCFCSVHLERTDAAPARTAAAGGRGGEDTPAPCPTASPAGTQGSPSPLPHCFPRRHPRLSLSSLQSGGHLRPDSGMALIPQVCFCRSRSSFGICSNFWDLLREGWRVCTAVLKEKQ